MLQSKYVKHILFASLALIIGCSENADRLPVYPVKGTVLIKGKPLSNALVAFHPVNTSDPRATSSRATTDESGNFTISTYDANDGAPAGEYKITVECYKLKGNGSSLEPGPNFLPPKYSQPTTTDISIRIEKGANPSQEINLK